MKKAFWGTMLVGMLCAFTAIVRAQATPGGEKTFKAKCAGCHGADAAGKAAVKSPSIKGKSAEDITKAIATSPKHTSLKKLTPEEIKQLSDYLGTLK